MIPNLPQLTEEIASVTFADRTYKIVFRNQTPTGAVRTLSLMSTTEPDASDRIDGYVDGLDAVIQSAYLILSTERYKHIIYSWDYGVELVDLIGQPIPYVMAELPRRIREALTQDERITDVVDFVFEKNHRQLHTTFTVVTNLGEIAGEMEVAV